MDYFVNYRVEEEKFAKLLDNNGMTYSVQLRHYPIVLTITKAEDAQTGLYDDYGSSPDSKLLFTFALDGLEIRTDDRFVITDDLLSKIKTQAKKLHAEYVAAFFAAAFSATAAAEETA